VNASSPFLPSGRENTFLRGSPSPIRGLISYQGRFTGFLRRRYDSPLIPPPPRDRLEKGRPPAPSPGAEQLLLLFRWSCGWFTSLRHERMTMFAFPTLRESPLLWCPSMFFPFPEVDDACRPPFLAVASSFWRIPSLSPDLDQEERSFPPSLKPLRNSPCALSLSRRRHSAAQGPLPPFPSFSPPPPFCEEPAAGVPHASSSVARENVVQCPFAVSPGDSAVCDVHRSLVRFFRLLFLPPPIHPGATSPPPFFPSHANKRKLSSSD